MNRNIRRTIAEEVFEYGNHVITVTIRIEHTNQYNGQHDIRNKIEGYHYYRFVDVDAHQQGSTRGLPEVSHRSSVALDDDKSSRGGFWTRLLGSSPKHNPGHPQIPQHVEHTASVVFDELEQLYDYTTRERDIEIDIAMERVESETSWVEVDDTDEFAEEIGRAVEKQADNFELN